MSDIKPNTPESIVTPETVTATHIIEPSVINYSTSISLRLVIPLIGAVIAIMGSIFGAWYDINGDIKDLKTSRDMDEMKLQQQLEPMKKEISFLETRVTASVRKELNNLRLQILETTSDRWTAAQDKIFMHEYSDENGLEMVPHK
jgi:hypothetical protein